MGLRRDMNYVKRIAKTPCQNNSVSIYLQTGLRAATPVLFDFLSFGCREPLKFAAGRGQFGHMFGYGNVRKGAMPHRKPKIAGAAGRPPTTVAGGTALWKLVGLGDRAAYYWFLAELAKDFTLNWTSLMYQENKCDSPPIGYCTFIIQDQIIGPSPGEMLIFPENACHDIISDTRSWIIPPGVQAACTYHCNSVPWTPAQTPGATLQTYMQSSDGHAYGASSYGGTGSGDTGVVGHGDNMGGGLGAGVRYSIVAQSSGFVWCTKGTVHVNATGRVVPLVPLQDCFKNVADNKLSRYLNDPSRNPF